MQRSVYGGELIPHIRRAKADTCSKQNSSHLPPVSRSLRYGHGYRTLHFVHRHLRPSGSLFSVGTTRSRKSAIHLQAIISVSDRVQQIVSIFAVNAPVINSLFRAETWATRHSSSGYVSKDSHRSRTNTSTLGKNKKTGFEIYKMTDIETKMTDFETSSKESTSELFKDPMLSPVPSQWRCSARGASQDGNPGRMA